MRSSTSLTVLTTLFLTSNVLAQQSYACQNGIKVCGEDASVSCSTYCTARLGNAVGYFAQPAQSSCSDDTPCVDPSNPQFTSPPTDDQLRAVGADLGNSGGTSQNNVNTDSLPSGVSVAVPTPVVPDVGVNVDDSDGNSQDIVTNLNSDSLPSGVSLPDIQEAVEAATASIGCPALFESLGLC